MQSKRNRVECLICGWAGEKFDDLDCGYGYIYENAVCPNCKSQPRHRSIYFYLKRAIPKNRPIKMLHVAPEPSLESYFKSCRNIDYLSVDIKAGRAMAVEDITKLSFPNDLFDIIVCIHVFEHVQNDRAAMAELLRVLIPGGFAVLDAPMDYKKAKTQENSEIKSPKDRTKAFRQWDHLRIYGRDYVKRLAQVGFDTYCDRCVCALSRQKINRYGLKDCPIHVCSKRIA